MTVETVAAIVAFAVILVFVGIAFDVGRRK
jgi:hypothetical protein